MNAPLLSMPPRAAAPARILRAEAFTSLEAVEPHWRALERGEVLGSPYQRFDFLSAWQRHVGESEGVTPLIAVGFAASGEPAALLPMGSRKVGAVTVAEFLGGKHVNFNMPLWRRDLAISATEADVRALLAPVSGHADALMLTHQSFAWQGVRNPLVLLPHQASVNAGYSGALAADFEALVKERMSSAARRKLRKKEEKLAAQGKVAFAKADDPLHTLEVFFRHKTERMRQLGQPDAFGEAGVRAFIEQAACGANPAIELYTLSFDGEIIAILGGVAGKDRFSAMFSSIVPDRFGAESPGEQLLYQVIRTLCARGFKTFDLGVGEAHYKAHFCPDEELLFDNFVSFNAAGWMIANVSRAAMAAKRTIKQNETLWSAVKTVRQLRSKL